MNASWVVPVVVAIIAAFGGTTLVAIALLPKTKSQMDANSTFQLTQSVVLVSQELDRLRDRMREMSAELDREKRLREAAEARVAEWARLYPPPPPGLPAGGV